MNGNSLPLLPILVVALAVLTWFFGWIVPGIAVAAFVLITAGTALFDRVTHASRCRWCNRIKSVLESERGLARERIRTKHVKSYDTHMLVQVFVDDRPDVLVDIDFNERILGTHAGPE